MAQIKVWNGSANVNPKAVNTWNGSAWVQKVGKRFTGSTWEDFISYLVLLYNPVLIEKVNNTTLYNSRIDSASLAQIKQSTNYTVPNISIDGHSALDIGGELYIRNASELIRFDKDCNLTYRLSGLLSPFTISGSHLYTITKSGGYYGTFYLNKRDKNTGNIISTITLNNLGYTVIDISYVSVNKAGTRMVMEISAEFPDGSDTYTSDTTIVINPETGIRINTVGAPQIHTVVDTRGIYIDSNFAYCYIVNGRSIYKHDLNTGTRVSEITPYTFSQMDNAQFTYLTVYNNDIYVSKYKPSYYGTHSTMLERFNQSSSVLSTYTTTIRNNIVPMVIDKDGGVFIVEGAYVYKHNSSLQRVYGYQKFNPINILIHK